MSTNPFHRQRQRDPAIRAIYADLCQSCGVCCISHTQAPFNIAVGSAAVPKQLVQIGPRNSRDNTRYVRITTLKDRHFTGDQEFRKCAALTGSPRRQVSCAIYSVRPECCSSYDPGSPACIVSREWARMEHPEDIFCLGRS